MPTLAPKLPWQHPFAGGYPGRGGQYLPTDADAVDYLNRVAAADGGASVEVGIAQAIEAFIVGCKADSAGYAGDPTRSNWDAIKASCIMCGARTLSGALVSLRQYGPELWDSSVTPTISDSGGSAGEWNAATLTMSNPGGTLTYIPVFTFGDIAATSGVEYRIAGRFSGDYSHVSRITFGSAIQNYPSPSPDFDFNITAASTGSFAIHLRGLSGPSSVRIESLSIKEVINDATNVANNFVEADYSRSGSTPGLKGNGTTKYIDTNRAGNADGQDDNHLAVHFGTAYSTANGCFAGSRSATQIGNQLAYDSGAYFISASRAQNAGAVATLNGLYGVSREQASGFDFRYNGSTAFASLASTAVTSENVFIFNRPVSSFFSNARLAFYSVGAALDLAALDTRVTNLVNAIKFHSLTGLLPNDYDPDTISYIVAAIEAGGTL